MNIAENLPGSAFSTQDPTENTMSLRNTILLVFLTLPAFAHAQQAPLTTTVSLPSAVPGPPFLACTDAGDVDNDGFGDYAVADPYEFVNGLPSGGRVRLISGATGATLSLLTGALTGEVYGTAIESGDFNGDGRLDIFVVVSSVTSWRIEIVDTATGGILGNIIAPTSTSPPNRVVNSLDFQDINGDGQVELLLAAQDFSGTTLTGYVYLFAGGTGTLISTLVDNTVYDFAQNAKFLDDLNADGVPEILVVAQQIPVTGAPTATVPSGRYGVYDTVTMTNLYQATGVAFDEELAKLYAVVDDQDNDGFLDFIVSKQVVTSGTSASVNQFYTTISGLTGATIQVNQGATLRLPRGPMLLCTDLDGDGMKDLSVRSQVVATPQFQTIDIYSSATLVHLDSLRLPANAANYRFSYAVLPDPSATGYDDFIIDSYVQFSTSYQADRIAVRPVLSPLAAGNHPLGAELLKVNNSSGIPARRVDIAVSAPFTIKFESDSTTTGPTDFLIFGMIGVPDASTVFVSSIGSFVFPPRPAAPGLPWLFTLADSVAYDPGALFTVGPAPYGLSAPLGIAFPVTFVLQGVSITGGGANLAISNAILVDIR